MGEQSQFAPPARGIRLGGRYRLDRLLGRGGMAEVWSATDEVLARRVAVKVLLRHFLDDPTFVERFQREAVASARFSHPGIVAIYDTISGSGVEAIVMELVEGPTLRAVLDRDGVLDEASVVELGTALAGALEAAHRDGIVHRDVKPANVLLPREGPPKIADFGIAKETDRDVTTVGMMIGTAVYLSPEQVEGKPTDGRSDVYSLGVLLYEAACGRPPFRETSDAATALARLRLRPEDPRVHRRALSPGFCAIVLRSLERKPDDRFASAEACRAALVDLGRGRTPTLPPAQLGVRPSKALPPNDSSPNPDSGKQGRSVRPLGTRHRWISRAVVTLLVGGSVLLIVALVTRTSLTPEAPRAARSTPFAPARLEVADVMTVDPLGTGVPGENDQSKDRVIDGDLDTAWRTERYEDPAFGNKPGVGLALRLTGPASIDHIDIDTATDGWTAEISILPAMVGGVPPPTGRRVRFRHGSQRINLDGAQGTVALIWITELAGGPGFSVDINEIRLAGSLVER